MSEMKGSAVMYVRAPSTLAESEVVPARDRAFVSEPYAVIRGFPQVPKYWVRSRTLASANGTFVSRRDDPVDIDLESHSRFVGNGFDNLSGVWRPFDTQGVDYLWMSPSGLEPSVDQQDYLLGKESISRYGLRFNPGDYLYSSFNKGVDDAIQFSVALVITPLVPTGYTVFATADTESELAITVDNGFQLNYANRTVRIPFGARLNHTPVYLVLTHDGANATLWAGTSTRDLASVTMKIPTATVSRMRFYLGKTHWGKATATMNLFDFSLFAHALNKNEVHEIISTLATAYGSS